MAGSVRLWPPSGPMAPEMRNDAENMDDRRTGGASGCQPGHHLKNVARLEITKNYYRDHMQETGSYELRNQEEIVIISEPRADYFEAMCDYFSLGKQDGDMTHCYLNAEYDMDQDCRAPERTCLILKASELRLLGREDLLAKSPRLPACRCLYTTVDSPGPFLSGSRTGVVHDRESADMELDTALQAAVAVPFLVDIGSLSYGPVFRKLIGVKVIGVVARYHLAGLFVKIIDIAVDLHGAGLELPRIRCKVPGVIPLDPACTQELIVSEVISVILVLDPVIGAVSTVTPLMFHALGRVHKTCGHCRDGSCCGKGCSRDDCRKQFLSHNMKASLLFLETSRV